VSRARVFLDESRLKNVGNKKLFNFNLTSGKTSQPMFDKIWILDFIDYFLQGLLSPGIKGNEISI